MTGQRTLVVSGAGGFLGAAVAAEAVRRGWTVAALVRPGPVSERLTALPGLKLVAAEAWDSPATVAALAALEPSTFVHSAWRGVGGADRNEPFQIETNLPLTLAAVRLARAAGCRTWVGIGSQAEYGNPNQRLDEAAPLRPTTLYGRAKLAAGIAALGLAEAAGMRATWLRVFSLYGPGDAPTWFIQQVIRGFLAGRAPKLTRCEQRWDYLHVADAAAAVVQTVASPTAAGAFNLGSGQATPLREIVEMIRSHLGTPLMPDYGAVPYRPDQVMHLEADITRLRQATGWSPRVPLAEGLRGCVEFLQNRWPA
jgi:nucleoside-diphosphate-sugar epimerase